MASPAATAYLEENYGSQQATLECSGEQGWRQAGGSVRWREEGWRQVGVGCAAAVVADHARIRDAGSTASGGAPASGPRSGSSGGGQAGAASRGEVPPAVGEGRGGLVLCPWRGAPAPKNVMASGPTLEKASDRHHGGIYHGGGRWRGVVVKNVVTGERPRLGNRRRAVGF
jgi:hypothetical protein